MTYLISCLAFAMAFGAIWFTCEAAKRTELCGKAMVRPHLKAVEDALLRNEGLIRELERRLASVERENKIMKAERILKTNVVRSDEQPLAMAPAPGQYRQSPAYNA